ncbi:glycosyltransferase family 2 protein [Flavobacterium sp.]|uniref:glycosyltransferase family 2 protein n=1 Tax=Flavobacterium sp. TaxID=239 RepID=UPI00375300DB
MILIYHKDNKVVGLSNSYRIDTSDALTIAEYLMLLAIEFPDELLIWCHINLKEQLNVSVIEQLFHHKKLLFSYNPYEGVYLDKSIGYVEESPFIKINKKSTYPTWQMSSWVGGVHSEVVLAIKNDIPFEKDFDYFLGSLAKLGMRQGLLCYSEPLLLKRQLESIPTNTSPYTLFRFVKQHYKSQWVFLLLFNLMVYERRFPVLPFLFSLFYKNRSKLNIKLDGIKVQSTRKLVDSTAVDVIIPTIGRKDYLHKVLKDFSRQTLLPQKIIIVEQNPVEGSQTELDYVKGEQWPFEIKHFFIHQAGACNARNLALDQTQNEWVFLADDDNRFEATLLSDIFNKIKQYGNPAVTTSYPQKNEILTNTKVIQSSTFGAGNSFVRRNLLDKARFNRAFEFGYGEDVDFGMQLRNQGEDILYLPEPSILHLKAPIGGFRTKPVLQWQNEIVQPKPSPTIMLCQILHNTDAQTLGYKTILFFKYYRFQKIKNPISYYCNFQKQWDKSVFWANELKKE